MEDYEFLSESELLDVRVRVPEVKAHSELCVVQAYCLNGGTCYRLPSLAMHYCYCAKNFEGKRCQTKTVLETKIQEVNESVSINWDNIKPLVIVIGGVVLCILAVFCIYLAISHCYKLYSHRKGKYRIAHPRSNSVLTLVIEENGNDAGTRASSRSRTRLPACSSTPEHLRPFYVQSQATGQARTSRSSDDPELGQSSFVSPTGKRHGYQTVVPASGKEMNSPGAPPSRRELDTSRGLDLKFPSVIDTQGSGANCQSPNDSNNNNEEVSTTFSSPFRNSSTKGRQSVGGRNKTPTLIRQQETPNFSAATLTHHSPVSDSVSPKESDLLYDTDPESTAL